MSRRSRRPTARYRSSRHTYLLTLLLTLVAAGPLCAQGVTYTTVTKARLSGALGVAARLAGAGQETEETTYIQGSRMRTDSDRSSTIVDVETGRFIWIDHEAGTYTEMSMDDMLAAARTASDSLSAAMAARPEAAEAGQPAAEGDPQVEWEFDLDVDPTGRTEQIAGYRASQVVVVLRATATATGENAETGETEEGSLQTAFVTDLWVSEEPEAHALMEAFGHAAAARGGAGSGGMTEALQGAFAQQPGMREGLERAAAEASKIEGMALRSVTHVVMLPGDMELDLERALAGAESRGPDVAGAAADAAKNAVSSRLGGLFGRKKEPEPEPEPEPAPQQSTVLSITSEVTGMTAGPLAADVFEVPAGYRRVEPDTGA